MAGAALVDSCVWIDLLRAGLDPARELTARARTMDLVTCGMVQLEVLRGVVFPKTRLALQRFFDVMLYVPSDNALWGEATAIAWDLGRRGLTPPSQDVLIAACARRIGAAVLTYDAHFHDIPGISILTTIDELR